MKDECRSKVDKLYICIAKSCDDFFAAVGEGVNIVDVATLGRAAPPTVIRLVRAAGGVFCAGRRCCIEDIESCAR